MCRMMLLLLLMIGISPAAHAAPIDVAIPALRAHAQLTTGRRALEARLLPAAIAATTVQVVGVAIVAGLGAAASAAGADRRVRGAVGARIVAAHTDLRANAISALGAGGARHRALPLAALDCTGGVAAVVG